MRDVRLGIVNAPLETQSAGVLEGGKLMSHDGSNNEVPRGLGNQMIELNDQECESQTHVSNSNGPINSGKAHLTQNFTCLEASAGQLIGPDSTFKESNIQFLNPTQVPVHELSHSNEAGSMRFGSVDCRGGFYEKIDLALEGCINSVQIGEENSDESMSVGASKQISPVFQENSQGLAVVLRKHPPLGASSSKGSEGIAFNSGGVLSSSREDRIKELQRTSPSCSSMSDSRIEVCNRRFWLRNADEEAGNIWNLGKILGVSYTGEKREMIEKLKEMEVRDCAEMAKASNCDGGEAQRSDQ